MKVIYYASVGYSPGRKETVELPDDFTEEDIEADFETWRDNYVEYGWYRSDENED